MVLNPLAIVIVISTSAALVYVMVLMLHAHLAHGGRFLRPAVWSNAQESLLPWPPGSIFMDCERHNHTSGTKSFVPNEGELSCGSVHMRQENRL